MNTEGRDSGRKPGGFMKDRERVIPWAVLAGCLAVSFWLWGVVRKADHAENRARFGLRSELLLHHIEDQFDHTQNLLAGGAGYFFKIEENVSRQDWRNYVEARRVEEKFPGIQGMGFAKRVLRSGKAAHIRQVRAGGFPDYKVWPAGERDEYFPIVYLEPFEGRNLRAFGYDMFSEPVRRAAMEIARDSAEVAVSSGVILVQETPGAPPQSGFLMYMPVYAGGPPADPDRRKDALIGYVYSAVRVGDFISSVLSENELSVGLKLYDGEVSPGQLIYDTAEDPRRPPVPPGYRPSNIRTARIEFYGHTWTAVFSSTPDYDRTAEASRHGFVLAGGLLASFLLFRLLVALGERAKSAAALKAGGEKTDLLLNSAAEGIYGIDLNGDCTLCNSACLRLLGYSRPEELQGRNMHLLMHYRRADGTSYPIDDCRIVQAFRRGEGTHVADEVFWRADGTSFPAEYWAYPQRHDGKVVGAVISFIDITERKKAEEALKTARERLALAADSAGMGVWEWDIASNSLVWDDRMYELYGISAGQFSGAYRAWESGVHPDDREESAALLQAAVRGEKSFDTEFRVVWPDKTVRYIKANGILVRSAEGASLRMVGVNWDITERRRAEEDLRKLAQVVKESPVSIVITDPNGAIEYVNPKFTQVTGYAYEEAIGQNPRILKSGEQPDEVYRQLWKTISAGNIWRGEFHNKKKNGELYWESSVIAPVAGADGRITHYIAVKMDVTERKRLEAELLRAKDAAEAANRAKSAFLANMSHEIRTPLNAIIGFSQLLLRNASASAPNQRQQIETIARSGEHLLALINDILEISKAEAGRATLNPSVFDLYALLDDVGAMLRQRAEAKGLRLEVERGEGLPRFATGDEGKLRQILLNLVGNAVKFTQNGSVILRLSVRPGAGPQFRLAGEVEDTGPGIAPDELERLFQPFEQAAAGRMSGGTGLGLSISRGFARLMGGDITAASEPGKGSVFSFDLTMQEGIGAAVKEIFPRRRVRGLKPGQPGYRVLVADDKSDNREYLRQLLSPAGFEVRLAVDGEEAVKEFGTWRPQLIVMDLMMPVLNGYEAMRRIRAAAGGGEARMVAVTAGGFGETDEKAFEAGADALLLKPFKEEELFWKIGELIGAEYDYEEAPASAAPAQEAPAVKSADLPTLPAETAAGLRQAAVNGDFDLVAELAGRLPAGDPRADALLSLAARFDPQGILDLLAKEGPRDR